MHTYEVFVRFTTRRKVEKTDPETGKKRAAEEEVEGRQVLTINAESADEARRKAEQQGYAVIDAVMA